MHTETGKHFSLHKKLPRYAQVTVAMLAHEQERITVPELFLNDYRIENFTLEDQNLVNAAIAAVREEESKSGMLFCVTRVESSYVDAHPEAARLAALAAIATLKKNLIK